MNVGDLVVCRRGPTAMHHDGPSKYEGRHGIYLGPTMGEGRIRIDATGRYVWGQICLQAVFIECRGVLFNEIVGWTFEVVARMDEMHSEEDDGMHV